MRKRRIARKVEAIVPTDKTLIEAFEEFEIDKEVHNVSSATLRNYRQSYYYFKEFNRFDEDTLKVNEIQPTDFHEWIYAMEADGVSRNSINHYIRDVRAFLYWCMDSERGYIERPFKIHTVKVEEEIPKTYTDEEIQALLAKPRAGDTFAEWRTWAMVYWFYSTGNRTSTVCQIKLEDIDWEARKVVLRHTKTKKAQITFLSPSLISALNEYRARWEVDSTGYLFPDREGYELSTNALRHAYAKYCHDRGVERTNLHGLRHTFAKNFIKSGGSAPALQKILGHSTPTQTLHYISFFEEDVAREFAEHNPLELAKRGKSRETRIKRKK